MTGTVRPVAGTTHRQLAINWRFALCVLVPIAALPVFMTLALAEYTTSQRLLAWILFAIGTAPMLRFMSQPSPAGVPLIELIGLQYALFFALPVFYEGQLQVAGSFYVLPASRPITVALVCAILAFTFILLGNGLTLRFVSIRPRIVQFVPSPSRLMMYGVVLATAPIALQIVGLGGAAFAGPMEIVLPRTLGLAILASLFYSGSLSTARRSAIVAVFVGSIAWGLLSGSTQLLVEPVLIWALARWVLIRKTPTVAAVAILAAFVILQPIKGRYRGLVGSGARTFTPQEAFGIVASLTRAYWSSGREAGSVVDETRAAAAHRLSLLMSTAHYIELTPLYVNFKGPRTLLYPTYSWVPRFLWPDKPNAQEANMRLPVEYGLQSPENVATTMFGVGHVAEVYTGIGLVGIIPVFLILGFLYAVPTVVLREGRSVATIALLIWFAVSMMRIESTIGNAFGSLFQQLAVQCILLAVLTRAPHRMMSARSTASA